MSPISMISTPDNAQLATYRWTAPTASPGRGIYLLHGLGEHAGRYEAFAQWLCARGWTVASHDHRGHGRSSGKRGVIPKEDTLATDAEFRLTQFEQELGAPAVLFGHSMGGLVATQIAMRQRVSLTGLILSSPSFGLRIGKLRRMLLDTCEQWAPNLRASNTVDATKLSHVQAVGDAYREDPLVHDRISVRLALMLERGGHEAIMQASMLPCRTLLLAAGSDTIVDPAATRRFADAAAPGRLALRWYEPAYHEVLNESEDIASTALADLEAWLAEV